MRTQHLRGKFAENGGDTAEIATLDSVVQTQNLKVGFIKADVEGMGYDLLSGSEHTIRRFLPVLSLSI